MVQGGGALWIACRESESIQRLDPARHAVAATIPLGFQPGDVAFAGGSPWVGSWNDGRLVQVDVVTNRITERSVRAGLEVAMMAADGHGIAFADASARAITRMPLP